MVSQIFFVFFPHGSSATVTQGFDTSKYFTEVIWLLCIDIPVCVWNFLYLLRMNLIYIVLKTAGDISESQLR